MLLLMNTQIILKLLNLSEASLFISFVTWRYTLPFAVPYWNALLAFLRYEPPLNLTPDLRYADEKACYTVVWGLQIHSTKQTRCGNGSKLADEKDHARSTFCQRGSGAELYACGFDHILLRITDGTRLFVFHRRCLQMDLV